LKKKNLLLQSVYYSADGLQAHLWWRVRNQKQRTLRSGDPWFQVALLWQARQYHSEQNINLATSRTATRMKTKNYKYVGRWSRQQSSNGQSAENGNLPRR
jgi:hypothetical protein